MSQRKIVIASDRSKTLRARTRGKPTPVYGDHKPNRSPMVGNIERLEDKIRLAHDLKARGFYNYEIADAVADRFGCTRPNVSTVSNWLTAHREAANEDIRDFVNEARLFHFKLLQEQLRKWLEVTMSATSSQDEQMKSVLICLKIMERQARLLSLDLPQSKPDGSLGAWEQMHFLEKLNRDVIRTPEGMHFPNGYTLSYLGNPLDELTSKTRKAPC